MRLRDLIQESLARRGEQRIREADKVAYRRQPNEVVWRGGSTAAGRCPTCPRVFLADTLGLPFKRGQMTQQASKGKGNHYLVTTPQEEGYQVFLPEFGQRPKIVRCAQGPQAVRGAMAAYDDAGSFTRARETRGGTGEYYR